MVTIKRTFAPLAHHSLFVVHRVARECMAPGKRLGCDRGHMVGLLEESTQLAREEKGDSQHLASQAGAASWIF